MHWYLHTNIILLPNDLQRETFCFDIKNYAFIFSFLKVLLLYKSKKKTCEKYPNYSISLLAIVILYVH
jgi:hypothetical protein